MWSVDPRWPPPVRYRPRPVAYVLAVLLPVLLLGIVAVPAAVVFGWARLRSSGAETPNGAPTSSRTAGGPGVGDPYFPDYGSSGYDALSYQINLNFDPRTATLGGTTKITARAAHSLASFYVDLALPAKSVQVNGKPAELAKKGFQDLHITPEEPIAAGAEFEMIIAYGGEPGELRRGKTTPWRVTENEWTVAGEPESSAWWFPANDHPSDPALMDVSVRVPAGMEVISVGRLESRDARNEPDFDTWHWTARQPMATYLNFLSIGQYRVEEGVVDGRASVWAVSEQFSASNRERIVRALRQSGAVVRELEAMFGPYPFTELGGVVPAHRMPFAGLETQTRPVYDARSILDPDFSAELLVHELAHMWFGNQVTVRQWNDIFLNEAYASWAQWGYRERTDRQPANNRLNATYDRLADNADFWDITMIDPGRQQLFSTVYVRGPMTLQALRNVIGDAAFFDLAREWTASPGSQTLEEWMIKAQAKTTIDLTPFFDAWILSPSAPAKTAANGFRG
jgi:aminopeptidase N